MTTHSVGGDSQLYLKPGAYVSIDGDIVSKKMTTYEIDAYSLLHEYNDALRYGTPSIIVPKLLEYDQDSGIGKITNIGDFRHYSPTEYFGTTDSYTEEYFRAFLAATDSVRRVIPGHEVRRNDDYEVSIDGRIPTLSYLSDYRRGDEPEHVTSFFGRIANMIHSTQPQIEDSVLYAGHRDPNPNNYSIRTGDDIVEVSIVDWETFGLARRGYEEGRFLSYLALSRERQSLFINLTIDKLQEDSEQIYFWRTAITRAYREVLSFCHGHYDSRIAHTASSEAELTQQKNEIVESLCNIINLGMSELSKEQYGH